MNSCPRFALLTICKSSELYRSSTSCRFTAWQGEPLVFFPFQLQKNQQQHLLNQQINKVKGLRGQGQEQQVPGKHNRPKHHPIRSKGGVAPATLHLDEGVGGRTCLQKGRQHKRHLRLATSQKKSVLGEQKCLSCPHFVQEYSMFAEILKKIAKWMFQGVTGCNSRSTFNFNPILAVVICLSNDIGHIKCYITTFWIADRFNRSWIFCSAYAVVASSWTSYSSKKFCCQQFCFHQAELFTDPQVVIEKPAVPTNRFRSSMVKRKVFLEPKKSTVMDLLRCG